MSKTVMYLKFDDEIVYKVCSDHVLRVTCYDYGKTEIGIAHAPISILQKDLRPATAEDFANALKRAQSMLNDIIKTEL